MESTNKTSAIAHCKFSEKERKDGMDEVSTAVFCEVSPEETWTSRCRPEVGSALKLYLRLAIVASFVTVASFYSTVFFAHFLPPSFLAGEYLPCHGPRTHFHTVGAIWWPCLCATTLLPPLWIAYRISREFRLSAHDSSKTNRAAQDVSIKTPERTQGTTTEADNKSPETEEDEPAVCEDWLYLEKTIFPQLAEIRGRDEQRLGHFAFDNKELLKDEAAAEKCAWTALPRAEAVQEMIEEEKGEQWQEIAEEEEEEAEKVEDKTEAKVEKAEPEVEGEFTLLEESSKGSEDDFGFEDLLEDTRQPEIPQRSDENEEEKDIDLLDWEDESNNEEQEETEEEAERKEETEQEVEEVYKDVDNVNDEELHKEEQDQEPDEAEEEVKAIATTEGTNEESCHKEEEERVVVDDGHQEEDVHLTYPSATAWMTSVLQVAFTVLLTKMIEGGVFGADAINGPTNGGVIAAYVHSILRATLGVSVPLMAMEMGALLAIAHRRTLFASLPCNLAGPLLQGMLLLPFLLQQICWVALAILC